MSKLQGKRIFIFQQRGWGLRVGSFLAQKLQAEGARLGCLTMKPVTHRFVTAQKDVHYDIVINHDELLGNPQKYLGGSSYPLADICRDLGVDSIWPLVNAERNYVRSYRKKFYYSFRQNVPDEMIIEHVQALYKCLRQVFTEFRPDLIIAPNFVTLAHLMFSLYADRQKVPMIAITDSRLPGWFIFAHDYFLGRGPFRDRVRDLQSGRAASANVEKAKAYIADFRRALGKPPAAKKRTLWQKLRRELSPYYQIWKWYTRGEDNFVPGIGATLDWRPPRIILRDFYARKRYRRFAEGYPYYPVEKLGKFVYFPLQVQPEEAIDVHSPFFSNQIETARQVAMSLPDDYTLAVKDHPLMAEMRPPSYLEKLALTPNVKLVDFRVPGNLLMERADLVVGPSGTSLCDAALAGKRVIQLGDLGTTLHLPSVFRHTDMTTLTARIKEVLATDVSAPEYERGLLNFVAAIFDSGISFDYIAAWERGRGDLEELWKIYEREITRVIK